MADMLSMDFTKANPQNWSSGQSSSSSGNDFAKAVAGAVPGLGLASAGVNLLDSLFGFSARRQQRHQKELMDKQQSQWLQQNKILQEQALEQWNRENEYNDPTNALKRLLNGAEANGITKAGVLGGQVGGVSGQLNSSFDAQGNTAMTSTAGAGLLPMGNMAVLGSMKQRAEINLLEAQAEKTRAEATTEGYRPQEIRASTRQLETLSTWNADRTLDGPYRRALLNTENLLAYNNSHKAYADAVHSFAQAFEAFQRGKYVEPQFMLDLYSAINSANVDVAMAQAYRELSRRRDFDTDLFEEIREDIVQDYKNQFKINENTADLTTFDNNNKETNWKWEKAGHIINAVLRGAEVGVNAYGIYKGHKIKGEQVEIQRDALNSNQKLTRRVIRRYDAKERLLGSSVATDE